MKKLSEKFIKENQYFINSKTGKIQYNKKCISCENECKQSFNSEILECKKYIKKEENENEQKKS